LSFYSYDGKTNQQYQKLKTVTLIWTTKEESDLVEGVKKICASDSSFKLVTYCTAGNKGTKRPAFPTVFDQHLAGFNSGASTAVLACGPPTMVEDVEKEAVRRAYAFHKESFLL
jgi:NAD(P)H-flavin reductase